MLKIQSPYLIKKAQGFYDEFRKGIDWGDDDFQSPWERYLEDNVEEYTEDYPQEYQQQYPGEMTGNQDNIIQEFLPELPEDQDFYTPEDRRLTGYEEGDTDVLNGETLIVDGIYDNVSALLSESMGKKIIKIDYTTRFGIFTSDRVVEPHRTFTATTTGNQILLTFDRTVNDIRGFIIGNIKPGGVKYKNTFVVKPEIMRERPPASAGSKLITKRR